MKNQDKTLNKTINKIAQNKLYRNKEILIKSQNKIKKLKAKKI